MSTHPPNNISTIIQQCLNAAGLCGTACTEEWGVPCVWETIANMPDSCMNM